MGGPLLGRLPHDGADTCLTDSLAPQAIHAQIPDVCFGGTADAMAASVQNYFTRSMSTTALTGAHSAPGSGPHCWYSRTLSPS